MYKELILNFTVQIIVILLISGTEYGLTTVNIFGIAYTY